MNKWKRVGMHAHITKRASLIFAVYIPRLCLIISVLYSLYCGCNITLHAAALFGRIVSIGYCGKADQFESVLANCAQRHAGRFTGHNKG